MHLLKKDFIFKYKQIKGVGPKLTKYLKKENRKN